MPREYDWNRAIPADAMDDKDKKLEGLNANSIESADDDISHVRCNLKFPDYMAWKGMNFLMVQCQVR